MCGRYVRRGPEPALCRTSREHRRASGGDYFGSSVLGTWEASATTLLDHANTKTTRAHYWRARVKTMPVDREE
jgi:hypothetical protein